MRSRAGAFELHVLAAPRGRVDALPRLLRRPGAGAAGHRERCFTRKPRAAGAEPFGFSSSIAALQAFRESPQRFDIVLTDESMPELAGTALAGEIAELRPDVPIVLMSGFGGAQLQERAQALGIRELLRKPLQRKDIAECFGRVLPK